MNKAIALALALAASGMALSPALASAQDQASVAVAYDDLDLSTLEGVAELDRRVDRAARRVCGVNETTLGTRLRSREARTCYVQAKRDFERRLASIMHDAQRGG
ncbi:UrcA family protein [Aurantiacibacter aquimixticola]|uniref:UrcA family protein n=1 Tax=Aurantiacibacter aquimixticola TaxID=1958945 RepID=A0A419RUT4_9SPHN|nr:UrcA family protein [Aurantiacibacter aquimixticola]RJY09553.1 UrcA family protein [Aurantiacibacter aquimixticola]